MKRLHLAVGLAAMLLTNQVKALNDHATGYLPRVAITNPMMPLVFFRPTPRSGTTRLSKLTKGDKTEEARSGRSAPS